MLPTVRVVFAAAVLCWPRAAPAAQEEADADPLRPLINCSFGQELKPTRVERWGGGAPWRQVQTSAGPMRVSIADGYRVLLAFPDTAPFVNLKLDRPQPGKLGADRTAILAQLTSYAATPGVSVAPFKVVARHGVEIMALNNVSLAGGRVVGVYTLIAEKANVIATAYLLNQRPSARKFKNYQEYQALRDDFIAALAQCMARLPAPEPAQ